MQTIKKSQENLNKIIKFLNDGGVAVFPTDTVYGFLALAENKKAVAKIYKIKKRPKIKPLAVFVKDFKMASGLAEIDEKQSKTIKSKWPGKYTFVLRSAVIHAKAGIRTHQVRPGFRVKPGMTSLIIKNNKIALRIPKYKFLNDLLKKINKPLAQTSVNISGAPPITKISDIIEQFKKFDILIVDGGDLLKSKPSKIINLSTDKINILRK